MKQSYLELTTMRNAQLLNFDLLSKLQHSFDNLRIVNDLALKKLDSVHAVRPHSVG